MRREKKKSELHLEWFLKEQKQSMLRQRLLIFQVLFHPVSQTWLCFKSVLQDGARLNSGELSRHQEHSAVSTRCWAHCRCSRLSQSSVPLCGAVDNQKKTCNPIFRSIWGVFFPRIWQAAPSLEAELQPSHLFSLSLFSNPLLIVQKLLHKVHFFLLNIDFKPFFIIGFE